MAKIEAGVTIDCSAEQVWRFITDISNLPKWDSFVLEARQTTAGPIGVGAVVQLRRRHYYRNADDVIIQRVTEYEPNQMFTLEYASGPIKGSIIEYAVEPSGGKTRLGRALNLRISGLYALMGPLLAGRAKRESEANLSAVKRILESEAQP